MSKSVYDHDAFPERDNFVAAVIARKGFRSRRFDTCFENRLR